MTDRSASKHISNSFAFSHGCAVCCAVLSLCALLLWPTSLPANPMPGMEDNAPPAADHTTPPQVETALKALLQAALPGGTLPDAALLTPLLEYGLTEPHPNNVRLQKQTQGSGAFTRSALRMPLQRVARYLFDPDIPEEALLPTSLRRHVWLPGSQILTGKVSLWKQVESRQLGNPPLVLRGVEYEEITPDTFSGTYYNYKLHRLVAVLPFRKGVVLLSVTRQKDPSSPGRKGAILGSDNEWNYLYTLVEGSNLKLAGWATTQIYDSGNITIFYESSPGAAVTEVAVFKYLRAGWSNINMVKSSHIAAGLKRYLDGLRQTLESSRLPRAEALAARARQIDALDADALREALRPWNQWCNSWAGKMPLLSSSDFKPLLQGDAYVRQLTPENMRSELIKIYMKETLGKAPWLASQRAAR